MRTMRLDTMRHSFDGGLYCKNTVANKDVFSRTVAQKPYLGCVYSYIQLLRE